MNKSFIIKISICLLTFAICLYSYVEKQNELTSIKIEIPKVFSDIENLKEEIKKMQYEVESFENPQYLMQLMQKPQFGHLKHPFVDEVLMLKEGVALFEEKDKPLYE
ncbi:MAG: hypothetical protein A3F40_03925 [Chlamydiae bacterium RIFCSPHIGHO2_12_FULL_27_8]|nr:MAG: hypothetical protein A3F40_03925 [Chlamydiae bacterium RIFCSPHIGHO2_12_FULL_27_8]OGN65545.1 MAG: hypothetical protein A2888_00310 [Chlamydiae bacterium RIFCSPLOWO2_01_FULL_28_7]